MGPKTEFHDLEILGCEGHAVRVAGFDATEKGSPEFRVDLRTGPRSGEVYG
jgi:hypothetical protein